MRIEIAKAILGYTKQYVDLSEAKLRASKYDWMYQTNEKRIIFAIEYTEQNKESDKWIIQYLKQTYDIELKYEHMEIFRLLHEVGHHVNGQICTEEEYYYLSEQVTNRYEYRQIPDEKAADLFAVNFIKKHMNNILNIL